MAVAAAELEPKQTIPFQPNLVLLPGTYLSADDLPLVAEGRSIVREEAEVLMATRQQQILDKTYAGVPLAVDAQSTAAKVIETRRQYGEGSLEYEERLAGLKLDCRRLLAEWRHKNKPVKFPLIRHRLDPYTEEYLAHGMSVWQMTEDALVPSGQSEEDDRRINERVEEATPRLLRKVGGVALGQTIRIRTVSECTDWAIKAYRANPNSTSAFGGYVPRIEKLMVRDMILDETTGDRFEEQMGLPGTYINHYVIQEALKRRQFKADSLSKTELHGTQLLATDDLMEFVQLLDEVGSEEWCCNIFLGEEVPDNFVKDYDKVREDAVRLEEELDTKAETLALFVMDLKEANTDGKKALELVEEFAKSILIDMAYANPAIATDIFDHKTALGLQQVAYLQSIGKSEDAFRRLQEVQNEAPGGGYCGAGSCDLERAIPGSEEEEALDKLGFDAKNTLIDKGDRKCRKCGEKAVAYDTGKGKKGCMECGATTKYKKIAAMLERPELKV